jgi:hypothetical protein
VNEHWKQSVKEHGVLRSDEYVTDIESQLRQSGYRQRITALLATALRHCQRCCLIAPVVNVLRWNR